MASDSDSDDGLDQSMDGSDDHTFVGNLVEAAASGNLEEVKLLVTEFNAYIDGADAEDGRTALQWASYHGHSDIVSYLLEKGADVNNDAGIGFAPIHMACESGAEEVIGILLAHGADINQREMYGKTPIYIASGRVSNSMIEMLLSIGACSQDRDFPRFNPLNPASQSGQYDVVRTLLDHGATLNGWDVFGRTPLQSACCGAFNPQWRVEHLVHDSNLTLKTLLEHGADPNIPDTRGDHILEITWMCFSRFSTEIPQYILPTLLDYGTGSGVSCRQKHCAPHCCNTTVLMCMHTTYRRENRLRRTHQKEVCEIFCDSFEKYFIKTRTAGLNLHNEEMAAEWPEEGVDWSVIRREAYRTECEAELCRMRSDPICETSATYFDLLTRNRSALQDQGILRKFNGDHCDQTYHNYSNMIHCSYVRLRPFFMVEECALFFSLLSPPLLSDCVEKILEYLSDKDMDNLVDIYRGSSR